MCGLIGIAGDLEFRDEATMKRMFIYDFFRGPDSTGFAALRKNNDAHVVKIASHPVDLFGMKRFDEALSGYNSLAFLGHNRLATKGKVNSVNAHPYQCGNIIGAHNGTLDSASWKRLNEVLGYDTDVDSHAIFLCIEKIGIEDTIKLMSEGRTSSEGAWALTWIDVEEKKMHFLRNKHRPLWYAYSEDFKKLFWASEWQFIDMATKLNDKTPYKIYRDSKGFGFWEMQEDWLYSFDLAELSNGSKDRPKPRIKILKGREPDPVAGYAPFSQGYQGQNRITDQTTMFPGKTTSNGSNHGKTSTAGTDTDTDNVVLFHPMDGSKSNPFGGFFSKENFDGLTKYGCSWCEDTNLEYTRPGYIVYEMTGQILCPDCSGSSENRIFTCREEIKAFTDKLEATKKVA
jgi:hypothetical protein